MQLQGILHQMKFGSETMYTCKIFYSTELMKQRNIRVSTIVGEHHNPKNSHLDVKAIWFSDFIMNFLPKGLSEIFPNVEAIGIIGCHLMEISKHDLDEFTNLKYIYLHSNKFKSLPFNLFEGKHKLQEISIIGNKELRSGISSELFLPVINNELEYVDLSGNKCVDAFYCPGYKGSLESVQQLMTAIDNNNETEEVDVTLESEAEDITDFVGEAPEFVPYETEADPNSNDNPVDLEAFQAEGFLDNIIEEPISIDSSPDNSNQSSTEKLQESSIKNVVEETEELITIVVQDSRFLVSKEKLIKQCSKIAGIIRRNPETEQIEIKTFSPKTVQNFVDFIDTGKISKESEAMTLYRLAAMLKVVDLEVECEEIILDNITIDNILEILELGYAFRSVSMKRVAYEKALEFFPSIVNKISEDIDFMDETFKEFIDLVHLQKN